jgi:hypothetical protein
MKTRKSGWTSRTSGKKVPPPIRGTLMHNLDRVGKACDVWLKNKGLSNDVSSSWRGAKHD